MRHRRELDDIPKMSDITSLEHSLSELAEAAKDFIQVFEEEKDADDRSNTYLRAGMLLAAATTSYEWSYRHNQKVAEDLANEIREGSP